MKGIFSYRVSSRGGKWPGRSMLKECGLKAFWLVIMLFPDRLFGGRSKKWARALATYGLYEGTHEKHSDSRRELKPGRAVAGPDLDGFIT
jgi:hypothetical protein